MLSDREGWTRLVEVTPPELPDLSHQQLDGVWEHVLVTDNVFGRIRVSPYAYAARLTHDAPSVRPTVVISTRDRNILAIESEVRGALGNGVDSFLVVVGDSMPHVDHLADHHEIVEHLRRLAGPPLPAFEVGMPTRFQRWQFRQRVDRGAQFLVAGPILDAATVAPNIARLELRDEDPPVFLMVIPPFSSEWVEQMEKIGAVPASAELRASLDEWRGEKRRKFAWEEARRVEASAKEAGCGGVIFMGLGFDTVVEEAARSLGELP